jgi:hypothetical protein
MTVEARTLEDWQDNGQSTTAEVTTQFDRIDIGFGTGAHVWIEHEDGRIRVHCYHKGADSPLNVEIHEDRIEIDDHDYQSDRG